MHTSINISKKRERIILDENVCSVCLLFTKLLMTLTKVLPADCDYIGHVICRDINEYDKGMFLW